MEATATSKVFDVKSAARRNKNNGHPNKKQQNDESQERVLVSNKLKLAAIRSEQENIAKGAMRSASELQESTSSRSNSVADVKNKKEKKNKNKKEKSKRKRMKKKKKRVQSSDVDSTTDVDSAIEDDIDQDSCEPIPDHLTGLKLYQRSLWRLLTDQKKLTFEQVRHRLSGYYSILCCPIQVNQA